MKKSLISLALLSALALSANAQDETPSASEFKPSAGNVTFEVNASSPFSGSGTSATGGGNNIFSLNNGLRFRYFLSDNTAIRLNFLAARRGFSRTYNNTQTSTFTTPASGLTPAVTTTSTVTDNKVVAKSSEFEFSIMPGIEKHKSISERLSVYYGAYLEVTLNRRKGSIEVTPGSTSGTTTTPGSLPTNEANFAGSYKEEVKGGWYGATAPAEITLTAPATATSAPTINQTPAADGGFTRIGLFGVIGADYYITKGLYLGLEAGWGFYNTSYRAIEVTRSGSYGAGASTTNPNPAPANEFSIKEDGKAGARQFVITPTVNAAFRLGFWF